MRQGKTRNVILRIVDSNWQDIYYWRARTSHAWDILFKLMALLYLVRKKSFTSCLKVLNEYADGDNK